MTGGRRKNKRADSPIVAVNLLPPLSEHFSSGVNTYHLEFLLGELLDESAYVPTVYISNCIYAVHASVFTFMFAVIFAETICKIYVHAEPR